MRIAYIITRADAVGGASMHVLHLARAMRQRGHETAVFVGGYGAVTERLQAADIHVHPLRHLQRAIHPAKDAMAIRELTAALRSYRPHLVSTHTAKAGLVGRIAARQLRLPALYTPHGLTIGDRISRLAGPIFAAIERLASRWCEAIVCVCEQERQLALNHHIAPPHRLRVIHNGMPDVEPHLLANPAAQPPRICCVARMEAPKDYPTLLRALATLQDLEWDCHLVGDGPLQPSLQALASQLGIGARICFLGYLPDPSPVLAAGQLFVLSTRSEAFPRSILEAMRAGLPVVASQVGGVDEAVLANETGLLCPPGDHLALAVSIRKLLENAPLRQRFGHSGRHTYSERFRLETMVETTEALYREILYRTAAG
ncbi:MAG: glycosyltransferase family 4 protein [Bryobacterales bacterium]|jgi:glycosyltransferase involved in cell wall biosynthesis|nr:glycosyltransferase family 4 protein [Bryobacterales bacterium]